MAEDNINFFLYIAVTICIALIILFYRRNSRLLNPKVAFFSFLTLFFIAGILRFNSVDSRVHNLEKFVEAQENIIDPGERRPIKITILGYVNKEPEINSDNQRLVIHANKMLAGPYSIDLDEQILVTTASFPEYEYGDLLAIYGQIKRPQNFSDFDYAAYLAKDAIYTTMLFPEIKTADLDLSVGQKIKLNFFENIFSVKSAFQKSIRRSIGEPNAAFIEGILLGSRTQISDELKEAFARTGTSHITAVSGYNITIVAGIICSFFIIFLRRPTAFWFSVIGVALFVILTGAQASVVRAAVMGTLVLLAQREGRLSDPRNAIVLAGAAMVLINPLILRNDIGFQLSFFATLGLIYLAPSIERYFKKIPNTFKIRETLIMTISAQIFVLPLLLYYFKSLSLVFLPANLIVLPTIPFAMAAGFAAALAGMILPFLGQVVGYVAWIITSFEIGVIKFLAKPDWASVSIGFSWYWAVALLGLIFWFTQKLRRIHKSTENSEN